jgi:hypothetical protein
MIANKRSVSTLPDSRDFAKGNLNTKLHPWYVTGVVDGEGSFGISILQSASGANKFYLNSK